MTKRSSRKHLPRMASSGFACVVALAIAGCAGTGRGAMPSGSMDLGKPATPLRKLNPAPMQAYEIRLRLANVPGRFEALHGTAQYDVANAGSCGKINAFVGAIPRITSNEPFELTQVSEREYIGTVHLDRIVDEAYYGREVCRWALSEARVVLVADADAASTRYVSGLDAALVRKQGAQTRYFWSGYYPRATMEAFRDFGRRDLADVPPGKSGEFFTIHLSAREIAR